jgi:acyl-coenzyme A synthetase/AMP-(fatty) acid ligase
MKTSAWSIYRGPGRIAVSLGVRGAAAGYKVFRPLAPTADMLRMSCADYLPRYAAILAQLDAVARVENGRAGVRQRPVAPPRTPAGGHILLTSGTTGRYKMVLIDEAFAAADLGAVLDIHGSTALLQQEDAGRSLIHQLNFGLWTAAGYNTAIRRWGYGGGVVIQQGGDILRSYQVPGLTLAIMIPALLDYILSTPAGSLPRNDALTIIVAGGALSRAVADQARARLTTRIATALGSTEGGIWAITPIETAEDLRWHRIHPSRTVQVVDEDHRPLPPGQLGQVRVRLDNGLSGYLGDPEATAASFRDGCFYPGDLGVLDERGRLALYGRASDVLNVLGDKIPAGPFEEALQQALGVAGVCIFSEQGERYAEELHVVLETAAPIDSAVLTAAAQAHLRGFPDARFHFLGALPRNHMGKVERFKLKQILLDRRRAEVG